MKTYVIYRSITKGCQVYACKAKNKKEALEKFKNGDDYFIEEEIEVQGLEDIDISDIKEKQLCKKAREIKKLLKELND